MYDKYYNLLKKHIINYFLLTHFDDDLNYLLNFIETYSKFWT